MLVLALAGVLLFTAPAAAQAPPAPAPPSEPAGATAAAAPCEPLADVAGDTGLSIVGVILQCGQELGLSKAQQERLERLGADLTREAIRGQAEVSLAVLDLTMLMRPAPDDPAGPADVAKTEAKIRDIGRITADMAVARFRAT
jgi:hypothetical protein